jgi:hypothetical protein
MLSRFIALVGALVMLGAAGSADVWDAGAGWSTAANPNGVWSYGTMTPAGALTPFASVTDLDTYPVTAADVNLPMLGYYGPYPSVMARSNGGFIHDIPAGMLGLHSLSSSDYTVVRWTSPHAGLVDISGSGWMAREIGRTCQVALFVDGLPVISDVAIPWRSAGTTSGNPFTLADAITAGGGWPGDLSGVPVHVGATIDLAFRPPSGYGDYIGFTMRVSEPEVVSEPAAVQLPLLLMSGGLAAWWRRRAA